MGSSIGPPSVFAEARIVQAFGGTIAIHRRGSLLEHRLERRGVVAEYPVAYSVGAGIVGYSYMVRLGRYLFQSPVSYYTQTKSWDLTPGYETEPHLDFTHQVSSGCLFCHTGSVNLIGGTANQFGDPPFTPTVVRQAMKLDKYSFKANLVLGTVLINEGKFGDEAKTKLQYAHVKYPEAKKLLDHWPDKAVRN